MSKSHAERHLRQFLPEVIKYLEPNLSVLSRVDAKYVKKIEERKKIAGGQSIISVEANLYDVIISARKGNNQAIGQLDFYNALFEELQANLTLQELKLIRSNVVTFLSSMGMDYLHSFGELAALNKLKRSGHFDLVKVEMPLPNKKRIDFIFRRKGTEQFYAVEIMNIHLDDAKITADSDSIRRFLDKRRTDKFNSKGEEFTTKFHLVPVIWGSVKSMKLVADYFEEVGKEYPEIPPLCYLMQTDGEGYYEHRFGTVRECLRGIDPDDALS